MSRDPGKDLLNVHRVPDIVPTLPVVGQVPQDTDSGM